MYGGERLYMQSDNTNYKWSIPIGNVGWLNDSTFVDLYNIRTMLDKF